MSEASTGTILPAFTSSSILRVKAHYKDTCATPLSREEKLSFLLYLASKIQHPCSSRRERRRSLALKARKREGRRHGRSPDDDAVMKLLYPLVKELCSKWARAATSRAGRGCATSSCATGRLGPESRSTCEIGSRRLHDKPTVCRSHLWNAATSAAFAAIS